MQYAKNGPIYGPITLWTVENKADQLNLREQGCTKAKAVFQIAEFFYLLEIWQHRHR